MDARTRLSAAVDRRRPELEAFLASLAAIRAVPSTGTGYRDCVELIAGELAGGGAEVELIEVPGTFLEREWGRGFEKTMDYLPVTEWAPRVIVLGRRRGTGDGRRVHLTQ